MRGSRNLDKSRSKSRSKSRNAKDSVNDNGLMFKNKVKSGINVTKSYLFQCYKEPNQPSLDNENIDKSADSSPGLSMSKLSKHIPSQKAENGCGKKFIKLILVKLTYDQS